MTSTLRTLLDRVEKGEGADREIDRDLHAATHAPPPRGCVFGRIPPYTASIDAAMALVEKVLPGYDHGYNTSDGIAFGTVWRAGYLDDTVMRGEARTPARAILAATLRAKIAQEERT